MYLTFYNMPWLFLFKRYSLYIKNKPTSLYKLHYTTKITYIRNLKNSSSIHLSVNKLSKPLELIVE